MEVVVVKEKLKQWKSENPLKRYRNENSLSQPDVAALLGIAVYSVQRWEDGSSNPSIENIMKLNKLINNFEEKWNEWKRNRPTL
jgi:transcriptional regulator with XRE-family HTH domain